jgi:ribosomal protein S18 acetylase RimI-like enzyme
LVVRSATGQDVQAIARIHVETWRQAYRGVVPQSYLDKLSVASREAAWVNILDQGASIVLVAEDQGSIIGFCSFGKSRDQGALGSTAELYAIYVAPPCWSTGVGRDLFRHMWQELKNSGFKRLTVWVLSENERAIRFYEGAGFQHSVDSDVTVEIGGKDLLEAKYEVAIS